MDSIRRCFVCRLESRCGPAIGSALRGHRNLGSLSYGAMMRAGPLGIFGAGKGMDGTADHARRDAAITNGGGKRTLYSRSAGRAAAMEAEHPPAKQFTP